MKYLVACICLLLVVNLAMIGVAYGQDDFAYDVAAKCKGEAAFALPECACTVVNRLARGWDESSVLMAYFAKPRIPTEAEVWMVNYVLENGCAADYYFMFSKEDVYHLGISHIVPRGIIFSPNGGDLAIYLYEYDYMQRVCDFREAAGD